MRKVRMLYGSLVLCVPIWALAQAPVTAPQPLSIAGAVTHVYLSLNGVELRLHVFNPQNHSLPRAGDPASLGALR